MTDRERERLFTDWHALRDACRAAHKGGPGGAVHCVCGAACGGSKACSMLGVLRSLVRYIPVETLPAEWQKHINDLRGII